MIYLDYGATSFRKPQMVYEAVANAMSHCASPGRGGYGPARLAQEQLFTCRNRVGTLFHCEPEQVVFTSSATHGLNMAIRTLVKPGDRVVISGFEHNAVARPLYGIGARVEIAGRRLFDQADTLEDFEKTLRRGVKAAVFTHVSNVFGYILPVEELAKLCRQYSTPFIVDAAQSAGALPVDFAGWGADFVAMPGHKGLLGPQGTGLLLCGRQPEPLIMGGTGSMSQSRFMPDFLPDGAEAGTANVPGIAGLSAGMDYIMKMGTEHIFKQEQKLLQYCAHGLQQHGIKVFTGENQAATVSFVPEGDSQEFADLLWRRGVAVRAGLHCAPFAHESAGTLETGTVRVSFGPMSTMQDVKQFIRSLK